MGGQSKGTSLPGLFMNAEPVLRPGLKLSPHAGAVKAAPRFPLTRTKQGGILEGDGLGSNCPTVPQSTNALSDLRPIQAPPPAKGEQAVRYKYLSQTGALRDTVAAPSAPAAEAQVDERRLVKNLATGRISREIVALVPAEVAWEHLVMPVAFDGETITFAAPDPNDIALADKLRFLLARGVRLIRASKPVVEKAIERHYGPHPREAMDCLLREAPDTVLDFTEREAPSAAARERRLAAQRLRRPLGGAARRPTRAGAYLEDEPPGRSGLDYTPQLSGDAGMFFYTVDEGQRALMRRPNGKMTVLVGPTRVWRGWSTFRPMEHYVAHPGEFLIVRFRDGRQQHLPGPAEVWFDPREHLEITKEDALQIAAKEAVVVYSKSEETGEITRRIEYGPAQFVPAPAEWLHTFSWHGSKGGSRGAEKVANALVFQKLWLMPDQMYHNVHDVRTADDAVLMIRLMIFFELLDIEKMLDTTHDPIGDFVNAATSDTVEFTGKHDFESFKRNTDKLNELETYRQLTGRAAQCGYRINKVVYRGYGAAESLQQMHNQAIEARTRLQLERATETQAQELENFKLESQMARASKRRAEQTVEVEHDLQMAGKRQEAELRRRGAQQAALRREEELAANLRLEIARNEDARRLEHVASLRELGVDLTSYLTQGRADRLIEIRGAAGTHLHLGAETRGQRADGEPSEGIEGA